jgi:hypothetical protein
MSALRALALRSSTPLSPTTATTASSSAVGAALGARNALASAALAISLLTSGCGALDYAVSGGDEFKTGCEVSATPEPAGPPIAATPSLWSEPSRLNDTQRSVLLDTRARAASNAVSARPVLITKFAALGRTEADLDKVLAFLRNKAQITLTFRPDRPMTPCSSALSSSDPNAKTVIDGFLESDEYQNQFQKKISGGTLAPVDGSMRDEAEKRIFVAGYHGHPLIPSERPKYGSLNLLRSANGSAAQYGCCYLVFKNEVKERVTFTAGDSFGAQAGDVGTIEHLEHLLLRRHDLKNIIRVALGEDGRGDDTGYSYIEAQVHGPVEFAKDFEALVISAGYRGTPSEPKLRAFAKKNGLKVLWHDEKQVTTDSGEVVP